MPTGDLLRAYLNLRAAELTREVQTVVNVGPTNWAEEEPERIEIRDGTGRVIVRDIIPFDPADGDYRPREPWSTQLDRAGYDALTKDDQQWLNQQWQPTAHLRPDISARHLT